MGVEVWYGFGLNALDTGWCTINILAFSIECRVSFLFKSLEFSESIDKNRGDVLEILYSCQGDILKCSTYNRQTSGTDFSTKCECLTVGVCCTVPRCTTRYKKWDDLVVNINSITVILILKYSYLHTVSFMWPFSCQPLLEYYILELSGAWQ